MIREDEVVAVLKEHILREYLQGEGAGLDTTTPLLELGILDSLRMMSLISFIEQRFRLRISDAEVVPEHFETLAALGRMVSQGLSRANVGS